MISNSCASCKREPETVIHALWGCETVKAAWGTNFDELRNVINQALSFVDLFCWFIWNRRNKIRTNEVVASIEKTSDLAQ